MYPVGKLKLKCLASSNCFYNYTTFLKKCTPNAMDFDKKKYQTDSRAALALLRARFPTPSHATTPLPARPQAIIFRVSSAATVQNRFINLI